MALAEILGLVEVRSILVVGHSRNLVSLLECLESRVGLLVLGSVVVVGLGIGTGVDLALGLGSRIAVAARKAAVVHGSSDSAVVVVAEAAVEAVVAAEAVEPEGLGEKTIRMSAY